MKHTEEVGGVHELKQKPWKLKGFAVPFRMRRRLMWVAAVIAVVAAIAASALWYVQTVDNDSLLGSSGMRGIVEFNYGRTDGGVDQRRAYAFEAPRGFRYVLHPVSDDMTELYLFNLDEKVVLIASLYDHTNVSTVVQSDNITKVADHTVILRFSETEELKQQFKDTLLVNGEKAYK